MMVFQTSKTNMKAWQKCHNGKKTDTRLLTKKNILYINPITNLLGLFSTFTRMPKNV
jgi:hypothetical protein